MCVYGVVVYPRFDARKTPILQPHSFIICSRSVRVYAIKDDKRKKKEMTGSLGDDGYLLRISLDPSGSFLATSCSDKNVLTITLRTKAVTEVTNSSERGLKTSTSTCLVFNMTIDMMAPINNKKQ